jgi:hypothetical protein
MVQGYGGVLEVKESEGDVCHVTGRPSSFPYMAWNNSTRKTAVVGGGGGGGHIALHHLLPALEES